MTISMPWSRPSCTPPSPPGAERSSFSQATATCAPSAEAIRAPLADAGLQLLQQGQGSRRRNLRDFRANPRSLLLGTSSYWEGIDLPGEQLVCLLIARLPFAVPTDPLNRRA